MPAAKIYEFADSDDPTKDMLASIGDLSKVNVAGGRVLLWTYVRPRKTKGGIILTDREVKEDLWQGAVGYVIKTGPLAFKDDPDNAVTFGGFEAKAGQWVTFSPGDAKRVQIQGVDCRLIEDSLIQMVIPSPEIVTHRQ